jgi:hypothetical protein
MTRLSRARMPGYLAALGVPSFAVAVAVIAAFGGHLRFLVPPRLNGAN